MEEGSRSDRGNNEGRTYTSAAVLDEWETSCTTKCRSVQHGNMIYAIGTKGTDAQVINLWIKTCQNFARVKDEFGRSAIHVAAATGRSLVVVWLIKAHGVNPNTKELVEGYTPLHMSIFYGQIHVASALIQNGAAQSLSSVDNEGLSPLELIVKDRPTHDHDLSNVEFDVHVWGSNRNYSLGIEKENGRNVPELLEAIPSLTGSGFVMLHTYHSVFVRGGKSAVFVAGTGTRLGVESMSAMMPVTLRFLRAKEVNCTQVAAGPDHTIFLMENGSAWVCGSNENSVLGLELDPSSEGIVKEPRRLQTLRSHQITNVAASQYHSVFSSSHEVFVCGLNYGQLGLDKLGYGVKVVVPQTVPVEWAELTSRDGIISVSCNEYTTVIATKALYVHILHKSVRSCIFMGFVQVDSILKTVVIGGLENRVPQDTIRKREETGGRKPKVKQACPSSPVEVFLVMTLKSTPNEPKVWRLENYGLSNVLHPVTLGFGRPVVVRDMAINQFGVMIVTKDGEGFQGVWDYVNQPLEEEQPKKIRFRVQYGRDEFTKMKRIPNVDRGYKVACCPKNDSFAVIKWRRRRDEKATFQSVLESQDAEEPYEVMGSSLLALLADASAEDSIHDCVFVVDGGIEFPAHRFILLKTSKPLTEIVAAAAATMNGAKQPVRVDIKGVTANIFGAILRFAYSAGRRDLVNMDNVQDSLPALNKWSKKFVPEGARTIEFSYTAGQEFSDVVIVCSDGGKLPAHRCMLASRLPYFGMMFGNNSWSESHLRSPEVKIPFPLSTVSWLLKYIYEGDALIMDDLHGGIIKLDTESIREIIQMSDMFLCGHLMAIAEGAMILLLNQRNVTDILKFSQLYNSHLLQRACNEFLVENIVYQLENRMLDTLSKDLVDKISRVYKELVLEEQEQCLGRVLRPYSTTPWDVVYEAATTPMEHSQLELAITDPDALFLETKVNVIKRGKAEPRYRTKSETTSAETSFSESAGNASPVLHTLPDERSGNGDENVAPTKWTKVPNQAERRRIRKFSANTETIPGSGPTQLSISIHSKVTLEPKESPPRKSLPIPIPLKQNAMRLQNLRLKQSDPEFDIAFDFPSLTDKNTKESSSICSPSTLNGISREGTSKATKKKLKWVHLHSPSVEDVSGGGEEVNESQALGGTPPAQNPWKLRESPKADGSPLPITPVDFLKIVAEEKEKLDNFMNATQKPLKLVQIEEEAMEAFRIQFTTRDVSAGIELLEIRRNDQHRLYADPVWPCERTRTFGAPAPVIASPFQSPTSGRTEPNTTCGRRPEDFPELK